MGSTFSLRRLMYLVFVAAVAAALFVKLGWPNALLIVAVANAIAAVRFWATRRSQLSRMAAASAVLIMATLFFTDWGLSSLHPVVRVAWGWLVCACILQVMAIVLWLVSDSPIAAASADQNNTDISSTAT